jgi:hypothetical protein
VGAGAQRADPIVERRKEEAPSSNAFQQDFASRMPGLGQSGHLEMSATGHQVRIPIEQKPFPKRPFPFQGFGVRPIEPDCIVSVWDDREAVDHLEELTRPRLEDGLGLRDESLHAACSRQCDFDVHLTAAPARLRRDRPGISVPA